jgi:HAD superfamily hydrolase (TIGR01549 family)
MHEVRFQRQNLIKHWGLYGPYLLEQGLEITPELATAMYPEWERMDLERPVPLVGGAKDVLYWAQRNNIKNCLLTSRNSQNIQDIFKRLDVLRYFDVLSCKQQQTYSKPDPRCFYFIEEELSGHGIAPDECVFIGDTVVDIEAGQKAGYQTLMVMTGPYLHQVKGVQDSLQLSQVLASVDALPDWVELNHDGELGFPYR